MLQPTGWQFISAILVSCPSLYWGEKHPASGYLRCTLFILGFPQDIPSLLEKVAGESSAKENIWLLGTFFHCSDHSPPLYHLMLLLRMKGSCSHFPELEAISPSQATVCEVPWSPSWGQKKQWQQQNASPRC